MSKQNEIPADLTLSGGYSELLNWGSVNRLSLCVRIKEVSNDNYLSIGSEDQPATIRIYSGIPAGLKALSIVAELRTDARTIPLTLSIPWASIGHRPHSLLFIYTGYSARLYVDEVLVDEDWPMGAVNLKETTIRVGPVTERAFLWKDAVVPDPAESSLEEEYLGTEPRTIQYWKPRGHNTGVGDCMPFYDGERFRLFYLYDRRGHASKWGLGAHQWAQSSTRDFRTWEHHPMAVGITAEWEGSICTGSVILKDQTYYAFYAVRAVDGTPARLTWATSADGIAFKKSETFIPLSDKYSLASVRDPHVFHNADDGRYHMLITTSLVDPVRNQGCLAHLVSDNLNEWTELDPFVVPGYHDEPECSDYFEWNGWYYLIFSNDGVARYRYAREPMGPWLRPAMDVFDCVQWRVPKTAPYPENRRIAAGFLSSPGKYAGELVIRELVQSQDGQLGLRHMHELAEQPVRSHQVDQIELNNVEGLAYRDIDLYNIADASEYTVSFRVTPGNFNLYYGLSISGKKGFEDGYDVRLDTARRKVGIHAANSSTLREDESASLYEVDGLSSPTTVEAIVKSEWIDLCINGQRTLVSRIDGEGQLRKLRLFVQFGSATFDRIRIHMNGIADIGGASAND